MTDRDLMQQALEALTAYDGTNGVNQRKRVLAALRERLARPEQYQRPTMRRATREEKIDKPGVYWVPVEQEPVEQEPAAWRDHVEQRLLTWRQSFVNRSGDQLALDDFMDKESLDDLIDYVCDEYTTPPRREWVGLTEEEVAELHHEIRVRLMGTYKTEDIYRAIEAKLKEKNA